MTAIMRRRLLNLFVGAVLALAVAVPAIMFFHPEGRYSITSEWKPSLFKKQPADVPQEREIAGRQDGQGVGILDATAPEIAKARADAEAARKAAAEAQAKADAAEKRAEAARKEADKAKAEAAALKTRLDDLEREVEALRKEPVTVTPEQVEDYNRRIEELVRELQEKLGSLEGEISQEIAALRDDLESHLDAFEQKIDEISARIQVGEKTDKADMEIGRKIEERLEETPDAPKEDLAEAEAPKRLDIPGAREAEIAERCPSMHEKDAAYIARPEVSLREYSSILATLCGGIATNLVPVPIADVDTPPVQTAGPMSEEKISLLLELQNEKLLEGINPEDVE